VLPPRRRTGFDPLQHGESPFRSAEQAARTVISASTGRADDDGDAVAACSGLAGAITFRRTAHRRPRTPAVLVERGIALVPEGRRTFPALTVAQNLRMGSWTKRRRRAELADVEERVLRLLSGARGNGAVSWRATLLGRGQQMLAVGRGLMSLPRLMLIDEASLGSRRSWPDRVSIVDRITGDGVTVILVEQNDGVLRQCRRRLVMERGRSCTQGSGRAARGDELRRTYLGAAS